MIQRHFKLALTAGHSLPLVINANQYDSGEQWLFTLYSDGVKYTPSTGAIVGIKADRLGIINTGSVDEAGRVVINETRQMTAAVGKNIFELLIDDQTHGTANFMVLVEPRPGDNADLSESDYSLFEEAIQGTSQTAIIAGVQEWMDENLTDPTDPIVDTSLSLAGAAADAKKTGDEISDLKSAISSSQGMSTEFKVALENLVNHVAFSGDDPTGRTYITALHTAMYPPANLVSISAVYTQVGVVYDNASLDDLKPNLVVTAHYDNSTTETVTNYALSGELTVGVSTITVSYGGKTTTFTVTVTAAPLTALYAWDLTESLTDTVEGVVATTSATFTQGTGVVFEADNKYLDFGAVYDVDRTYEIDVASFGANTTSANNRYRRLFVIDTDTDTGAGGAGFISCTGNSKNGWWVYLGSAWDTAVMNSATYEAANGKTVKIYVDSSSKMHVYTKNIGADDSTYESFGTVSGSMKSFTNGHVYLGGSRGDYLDPATITGFRVYEGEV